VRPQLGHVGVLGVGDVAGQHLVEDAAKGVDVGAAVDRMALDLLGRDVVRRANPAAGAGERAHGAQSLRQTEVREVDVFVLRRAGDEDVGRLNVPVDQSQRMRGVERVGDVGGDPRHPRQGHRTAINDVTQVRAGHEAHRQVEDAILLAAAVDRHDVGVFERGRQSSLRLEPGDGGGILRVLGCDDLQRHGAVEVDVDGLVDDAHPAAVEHAHDPIAREDRSSRKTGQSRLPAIAGV
jgi:hypothetical protein